MDILKSLTIKNLKLNKKRTIVTIIGIMLATALIVALSSLVFSFRESFIEFEKNNSGDYHYAYLNVPKKETKYIENNRNIEKTYLTEEIGYTILENSQNENKPYMYLQAFSKDAFDNLSIKLLDGRLPENDNEIVISNHIKTNARVKYSIGDVLTLSIGKRISDGYELTQNNPIVEGESEQLEENFTKTYTIVGIIERPCNSIEAYSAPGYTIITALNENETDGNVNIYARYTKDGLKNQYVTTANILETDEKTVRDLINGENTEETDRVKYDFLCNSYLIKYETMDFSDSTMLMLYSLEAIIIVIIIVTSIFCIRNSFAISITEKIQQYGMLASVGTTSKQIKKNVYFESIVLAIIGIPLGIILGLIASFILIKICNILLKDSLPIALIYRVSIVAILISTILSVITCLLSARSSAKKASKISPIDAIKGNEYIKVKNKKMKSPRIIRKIWGIGGDIAYKNLKRNNKKYRTTVVSIVVCVAVFIATSSFVDLAFRVVKIEMGEMDYNISIRGNMQYVDTFTEKLNKISTFENVGNYTLQRDTTIVTNNLKHTDEYTKVLGNGLEKNDRYLTVYSVGKEEYNRYIEKLGLSYEKCKDKAILINNFVVEIVDNSGNRKTNEVSIYNYKKGDTISGEFTLTYSETEKNKVKEHVNIEICAVTNERPMALKNNYYEDGMIIVSDEFMDEHKEDISPYVAMYIDSSNADKLQDDIDAYLNNEGEYYIENVNQNMRTIKSMYLIIAIFLYGFITVIALIGITNIFNTITTSMELRSKEFAMLKSVGMTKKEFARMIKLESFFYGTKSLIIGIPIGIGLSALMFKALKVGYEFSYQLPIRGIIISLIAVFLLVWSIMKFSLSKINKQNIIETIRKDNI